jgi:uncharacterized protein YhbP (UPF0306 family)
MNLDWPKRLKDCLESTQFMALATSGPEKIWNHAVFFAYDTELNFYFISEPHSRHMNNIKANPEVAVAIFSTQQSPTDDVLGLQIRGQAQILSDDLIPAAHAIYYQRSPEISGIPADIKSYLGDAAWKFVKITPDEIGLFDTEASPERQTAPKGVTL